MKLISVDLRASFGMLKKPDTNVTFLTFNMLHKPAVLGIMGAILGKRGFKVAGKLPEYYKELMMVRIGLRPLNDDQGDFQKATIIYKNATGMASKEEGGTLVVHEQNLINPGYRCYILIESQNDNLVKLDRQLNEGVSDYIPYLGKNENHLWWENYRVLDYEVLNFSDKRFVVNSLFRKKMGLSIKEDNAFNFNLFEPDDAMEYFIYRERLPIRYDEDLMQYAYELFYYTNFEVYMTKPVNSTFLATKEDGVIEVF